MNYQTYTEMPSSNSPSPDTNFSPVRTTNTGGPNDNRLVCQINGHNSQHSADYSHTDIHTINNKNNNNSIIINNNNININNNLIKHCAGCGGKIVERFYLHAMDRYWHNNCLKCYSCSALLADIGASCFTRSGMILCKPDYYRMFGTTACASCGQIIMANEFVMRTSAPVSKPNQQIQQTHSSILDDQKRFSTQVESNVFHLKCFVCSKCASHLRPGDRYYMLAGSLVCEQDWQKLLKSTNSSPQARKGRVGRPRRTRD